jgi:hypothetical protein
MIIGISGKKQHGKDTVCKIIQYLIMKQNLATRGMKLWDLGPQSSTDPLFHYQIWSRWDDKQRFTTSGWERKLFAEKLKQMVCLLIGCTMEQLEDNDFKNKELGEEWRVWRIQLFNFEQQWISVGKVFMSQSEAENDPEYRAISISNKTSWRIINYLLTPRLMLQLLGTEAGRRIIHPNIWVNALFADYKPSGQPLGLADMSSYYPDWIITDVRFPNEVDAIRNRGGVLVRVHNPRIESIDTHESETALDNYKEWDGLIINDGDIPKLIFEVEYFLDSQRTKLKL